MKDLRDWYSYLERSVKDPKSPSDSRAFPTAPQPQLPPAPARLPALPRDPAPARPRRQRMPRPIELQQPLPMDLGAAALARRAGRPPLTESRDAIIRRLLDPDLTLHEAAAILNLSKATLRRYTDQGKLMCQRTGGGQRRFKLSDVLALLEQRGEAAT